MFLNINYFGIAAGTKSDCLHAMKRGSIPRKN